MASRLVRSPLDGIQPLARDIVLCSCERHWTLVVPLSMQCIRCRSNQTLGQFVPT